MRRRPVHHVGYVVEDLSAAAERFADTVGAGPFLHLGHVPIADATHRGRPAVYDHETAFGQWGAVVVELSVIHAADPPELGSFMGAGRTPAVGHIGYHVPDLEAETEALLTRGHTLVHTGGAGPVRAHWFDGGALFDHPIEVLRTCPEILGLYAAVHAASLGWDGAEPLRPGPGPPHPSP